MSVRRSASRSIRPGAALLLLAALAAPAHAQVDPRGDDPRSVDPRGDDPRGDDPRSVDPRTQAAEHFDRGIAFYNERRFDAALAELARAYELFPAYQTLYNLARVHAALGQSVEAARAYERYLAEAGPAIDARRRREAEAALAEQRARIGTLMVVTDVEGARIAIDGVDVATTPLSAPIPLAAGSHTVEVRAPGRETVRRAVAVAGQGAVSIDVVLREEIIPRGTLRVVSELPDVGIAVDGEPIGVTPLPSTVPLRAGEHEVTASRRGYQDETRRVVIEDGAEAEVRFALRRDPAPAPADVGRVRIELPNAPYIIRVDGEPMLGLELELPVGPHRIELEVTDRQPYEGTLRVPSSASVSVAPPLSWTLEARRARVESASAQGAAGAVLSIGGGLLFAAGLPLAIWNEGEIAATDRRIVELSLESDMLGCSGQPTDSAECLAIAAEGERLSGQQDLQDVLRPLAITSAVLGGVLAAMGIPLWLSAPSSDAVDAAARASLRLGPGGLSLAGSF